MAEERVTPRGCAASVVGWTIVVIVALIALWLLSGAFGWILRLAVVALILFGLVNLYFRLKAGPD